MKIIHYILLLAALILSAAIAGAQSSGDLLVYKWDGTKWVQQQVATAGNSTVLQKDASGTLKLGTIENAMLAGSIANNKLASSSVTIGSTAISLGDTSTTLAGLTSVTSTTFVGNLTGNASTVTNGVYTTSLGTGVLTALGNTPNASGGIVTYSLIGTSGTKIPLLDGANTFSGATIVSTSGAASTPALKLNGSLFTGGSSTSTKPLLLIEPSGTTSTGWSTLGTFLGINAASGFTGNLIDAQLAGVPKFQVDKSGVISSAASSFFLTGGTYGFSIYNVSEGYWCISRLDQAGGTQSFEWSGSGANGNVRGNFGIGTAMSSADAVLSRRAAKVLGIINSISGSSSAGNAFSLGTQTVSQLTSAATAGQGALAYVTDATSTSSGTNVSGGGSNKALLISDGTNWKIIIGF